MPTKKRIRRLYVVDYLVTPDQRIEHGAVLVENRHILAVGGVSGFSCDDELEILRFPGAYMTPGFIDTHIHGAGGCDCSRLADSPHSLADMSRLLGERGVTGFFPTVVADRPERMLKNLEALNLALQEELPGAAAVGINIEGPFLNPAKCGAQPVEYLSPVDLGFASELLDAAGAWARSITFAPELEHSDKLIELLVDRGVKASMGHSIADEAQAMRAVDVGACHCTHLFNGMPTLHQRNLSITGVALIDNRVTSELIIDGHHIHSRMVDLACRCKPVSQIIGISDCTMAAGMPDGEYHIGPSPIIVRDGYSQNADGRLAGTTTMLDTGWHSLMSSGHLSETRAAQTVTANPAHAYGMTDRGVLLPTRRADLAIFERKTNRPLLTVCNGEIIYRAY